MKLFGDFEAVKFYEENLIFVTHDSYLYYIYNPKYNCWEKYRNAGNDTITVQNYGDVSKKELIDAMQGVFPKKETDFMRLCDAEQLCISNMLDLLKEDFKGYMEDYSIYHTVHRLLLASDIRHKSFEEIKKLFANATAQQQKNEQVIVRIKDLCLAIIGRDIFKKEIGIVDGHNYSSYFWIAPARVIDYSNTNERDNVALLSSVEISIEEDNVATYLTPFLFKYYDDELEANKNRIKCRWADDAGNEEVSVIEGFEWFLTHNFFTFDSMGKVLEDITATIDALVSGNDNEFTEKLKGTETELVVDFYHRFIYRMEYIMKVGNEKGYDLISVMGP